MSNIEDTETFDLNGALENVLNKVNTSTEEMSKRVSKIKFDCNKISQEEMYSQEETDVDYEIDNDEDDGNDEESQSNESLTLIFAASYFITIFLTLIAGRGVAVQRLRKKLNSDSKLKAQMESLRKDCVRIMTDIKKLETKLVDSKETIKEQVSKEFDMDIDKFKIKVTQIYKKETEATVKKMLLDILKSFGEIYNIDFMNETRAPERVKIDKAYIYDFLYWKTSNKVKKQANGLNRLRDIFNKFSIPGYSFIPNAKEPSFFNSKFGVSVKLSGDYFDLLYFLANGEHFEEYQRQINKRDKIDENTIRVK